HRGAQAQSCQAEADLELGWYLTETIAEISANCFESGFVLYPVERGGQFYPQLRLRNVRGRDRKCDAELHIGPALRMIIQALHFCERMFKQTTIEGDADGLQMARLLVAKQFTGAANVEIAAADVEARTKR